MKKLLLVLLLLSVAPLHASIAFNGSADGGNATATSLTFAYTPSSGANRLLVIAVIGDLIIGGTDDISSVTFDTTQTATLACKITSATVSRFGYFYYVLAPNTGTHNVVVTASTSHFLAAGAADYTGVKQSAQPDAMTCSDTGFATSHNQSVTTVADNSWAILATSSYDSGGATSAGSGVTKRNADAAFNLWSIFDSNAAITPAGSYATNVTTAGTVFMGEMLVSFQPDTGGGGSDNLKGKLLTLGVGR